MKPKSTKAKTEKIDYGLVANGSSRTWDVAVDETLSGPQRWFVQLDGPFGYLYFQVRTPKIVDELLSFLNDHLNGDVSEGAPDQCELEVGRSGGNNISFVWDNETNDQCFVLLSGQAELRMRLCISRPQLEDLLIALEQVKADLCDEDLLRDAV